MDLYFHVMYVNKKKECRFHFYYTKDRDEVLGTAIVDFRNPEKVVFFDHESDCRLNDNDKTYIVQSVLKHI